MEALIFWIFAGLAVVSSLLVVAHKSPIYATLSLVVTLFSVAVLFVLLGAPFLGVLQVLVYAGAIVVLFLFVIMLLNVGREEAEAATESGRGQRIFALLGGVLLSALLIFLLVVQASGPRPETLSPTLSVNGEGENLESPGLSSPRLRGDRGGVPPLTKDFVALKTLARALFGDYLLGFEIVGLLLLIAVVGATVATRRPPQATTGTSEDEP